MVKDGEEYHGLLFKLCINIHKSWCGFFVFSFLQHGADPLKKTRDGQTPLDLVKEGDTDVADLLRGEIL